MIKPFFQPYSQAELLKIVQNFGNYYGITLRADIIAALAKACRGTPRIARELVQGAKALQTAYGREVTPQEALDFKEVEPDGTTRQHNAYLTALYQHFGRESADGYTYITGEGAMMSLLRKNKTGLARLERFLIERGLIDRTPQGRRLTDRGIARSRRYEL